MGGGGVLFSSRRRHTRCERDWSSDVCSYDRPVFVRSDVFLLVVGITQRNLCRIVVELERFENIDRKSVVKGKRVDLGGRRNIKKKKEKKEKNISTITSKT